MCCFSEIVEGLMMVDVDCLKGGSDEVRQSREGRLEAAAFCSAPRTMAWPTFASEVALYHKSQKSLAACELFVFGPIS